MDTLLSIKGLSKSFAVPVLKNLDFDLRKGEIHALMGSNGAGKSTLCNIVCGVHQANSGEMIFDGAAHIPDSIKSSESVGIRMVMQELNLFPTLSIAENLCFKSLNNRFGVIDQKALRQRSRRSLSVLNLDHLNPDTPVSELGVGQKQLIEIVRVISEPLKLLILDEPTASLTAPEIDELFVQLDKLRSQGIGIIYISHRMDEISRIADRVSVLRDGELVATTDARHMDTEHMVNLMAGSAEETKSPAVSKQSGRHGLAQKPALKIEKLGRGDAFKNINLKLNAGEVLGIGGLIGSGRTELLRAIFGADIADTGGIRLAEDGFQSLRKMRSPMQAIKAGIGLVVEDRKDQGLLLSSAISTNINLCGLAAMSNGFGLMNTAKETQAARDMATSLAIKYDDLKQPVLSLSGGNQQKTLMARWLLKDLPILLIDEPSRGVDARAKARIHGLIRELARQGKAIIVVSSETKELFSLSDRIVVLSNGQLAAEFDADNITEEQLLEASFRFYTNPAIHQEPDHETI